jgi:two-component system, NarL family, response regulator NreC
MKQLRILLIEESFIVREGIKTLLSLLGRPYSMEECEHPSMDLSRLLSRIEPNIVIVNPNLLKGYAVSPRKINNKAVFFVGLCDDSVDEQLSGRFDFVLSIKDDKVSLLQQFEKILEKANFGSNHQESNTLSERETSVCKCVALGLTNNEIGEKLFISTHTVMTHRKNITRKLGIKTVSGLTVYAILNKLIKVEELQVTVNKEEE